ncbi:hypothetical protein [Mycobacterium intracellulare]|uniref:DUF7937 domain-containing protein n=1 Tax=Mycobacterium intracellulare TaxID=1767 RepID=UPI000569F9DA|nr:hypothetical protein [Mycobacterium intracellulare]MCA2272986.1 hypothetical protein [Mycobacterium intracellulare]MCA2324905.1 hypothetical protein [Mycobacterium intracellulare]UEB25573.1 hypothetical protein LK403_04945 [Mycobacterium intracellulare]BCO64635.1 hypothetical protein MINTM006_45850 [Mycobacterium intracellulare]BCO75463.1 hypothetical protein MINTM008_47980 [Mycobacterium intracellulare]
MVSQSSDDTPTGPIGARAQQAPAPRIIRPHATGSTTPVAGGTGRRRAIVSDATAVVLLVLAVFLPWNLYFGVGIPGSSQALFAVLLVVTVLAVAAVAVAGSWRSGGERFNPASAARLRLALNAPYLLLVLAVIAFDAYETVRFGGTVTVPGGVGPGAWVGVAGSLLSAQAVPAGPVPADDESTGWHRSARTIGALSMLAAVLSFGFNLYWRVRYALQSTNGAAEFGKQNIAVIATAVVYGVVALVAVLVASRWLLQRTRASRLTTVALGASALAAGFLVWILPVGRDLDAFHGIAQNTSTAGVGFEGYLAWAAGAAIFAPRALFGHRNPSPAEESAWRSTTRNGLLLIAVWAVGSIAMRLTDLVVGIALNYPFSRYDSVVLAAFDLVTAALAIWLRRRLAGISARLVTSLCGLVAALSVARVIVGVALAPRFADSPNSPARQPVYGNDLAQQITSTFDVTLCGLALGILAAAVVAGQLHGRRLARRAARKRAADANAAAPTTRVRVGQAPGPSAAATTRMPTGGPGAESDPPTAEIPPLAGSPRIFRGDDSGTRQIPVRGPQIFRPPQT